MTKLETGAAANLTTGLDEDRNLSRIRLGISLLPWSAGRI
jgi:hypothetical protein